jgi:hypothetical protein
MRYYGCETITDKTPANPSQRPQQGAATCKTPFADKYAVICPIIVKEPYLLYRNPADNNTLQRQLTNAELPNTSQNGEGGLETVYYPTHDIFYPSAVNLF